MVANFKLQTRLQLCVVAYVTNLTTILRNQTAIIGTTLDTIKKPDRNYDHAIKKPDPSYEHNNDRTKPQAFMERNYEKPKL